MNSFIHCKIINFLKLQNYNLLSKPVSMHGVSNHHYRMALFGFSFLQALVIIAEDKLLFLQL